MDASLRKDGPRYTVQLERQLTHSPEKVWRVLTERELLNKWFPSDVVGEWKAGTKLQFVFEGGEGEGAKEEDLRGEVLTVEPGRLLEFTWGKSLLRCELIAEGGGCRLVFSESFEDGSIAARNAAGWELCLDNLGAILEDKKPAEFSLDAWRVPFQRYVEKFQPVAGTQQGPPDTHPAVVEEKAKEERKKKGDS